jgi:hypothetical protein
MDRSRVGRKDALAVGRSRQLTPIDSLRAERTRARTWVEKRSLAEGS